MSAVNKDFSGRLATGNATGAVGQLVCYLAAAAVLCVGLWALPAWIPSARERVLAIILLTTVSLLLATLGSLSGLAAGLKRGKMK